MRSATRWHRIRRRISEASEPSLWKDATSSSETTRRPTARGRTSISSTLNKRVDARDGALTLALALTFWSVAGCTDDGGSPDAARDAAQPGSDASADVPSDAADA